MYTLSKKLLFLGALFLFMSLPAYAHNTGETHAHNIVTDDGAATTTTTTTNTPSSSSQSITLVNPLDSDGSGIKDIPTLIQKLLEIVLKIGAPIIALAIIYAGYLFIAAQGNPTKLETAKKTLVWVVVGAAILLGAYVIAESIVGTVNANRGK